MEGPDEPHEVPTTKNVCQQFSLEDDSDDCEEAVAGANGQECSNIRDRYMEWVDGVPSSDGDSVRETSATAGAVEALHSSQLEQRRSHEHAHGQNVDYAPLLHIFYEWYNPSNIHHIPTILSKFAGSEESMYDELRKKYLAEQPDFLKLIRQVYASRNPRKLQDVPALLLKFAGKEYALYLRICAKYKAKPDRLVLASAPAMAAFSEFTKSSVALPTSPRAVATSLPRPIVGVELLHRHLQEAVEREALAEQEVGQLRAELLDRDASLQAVAEDNSELQAQLECQTCAAQAEGAGAPKQGAGAASAHVRSAQEERLHDPVLQEELERLATEVEHWRRLYAEEARCLQVASQATEGLRHELEESRARLENLPRHCDVVTSDAVEGCSPACRHADTLLVERADRDAELRELAHELDHAQRLAAGNASEAQRAEDRLELLRNENLELKGELERLQGKLLAETSALGGARESPATVPMEVAASDDSPVDMSQPERGLHTVPTDPAFADPAPAPDEVQLHELEELGETGLEG